MTAQEREEKILAALDQIRPFLKEDGGDIELIDVSEDTVKVEFKGACKGCAFNTMTFQNGVQDAIQKAVPEIKNVVAVDFN